MTVYATTIGATGLYLLFIWLISAAAGSWISDRKGYGEKVGLTFGLLLSLFGLIMVLLLPIRPGSRWRLLGITWKSWIPLGITWLGRILRSQRRPRPRRRPD